MRRERVRWIEEGEGRYVVGCGGWVVGGEGGSMSIASGSIDSGLAEWVVMTI